MPRYILSGSILVVAASQTIKDWVLAQELTDTLDDAAEIFPRTSETCEWARWALRLILEIRDSLKQCSVTKAPLSLRTYMIK